MSESARPQHRDRDPGQPAPPLLRHAVALRADDHRGRPAPEPRVPVRRRSRRVGDVRREARRRQVRPGGGHLGVLEDRRGQDRAAARHERLRVGHPRGGSGQHQGVDRAGVGRADQGAQVAGVLDAVGHQHQTAPARPAVSSASAGAPTTETRAGALRPGWIRARVRSEIRKARSARRGQPGGSRLEGGMSALPRAPEHRLDADAAVEHDLVRPATGDRRHVVGAWQQVAPCAGVAPHGVVRATGMREAGQHRRVGDGLGGARQGQVGRGHGGLRRAGVTS